MGFFGGISRIIFCGLLLYSAIQTFHHKEEHATELVAKYGVFQQLVKNHTGFELPHNNTLVPHKNNIVYAFIGSEALTSFAILTCIPYVGIFYLPYLLISLLLEDNFLLAKGAERTELLHDFLIDLAIFGAVLMFTFPPLKQKVHEIKEKVVHSQESKKNERSDSPKGGKKKAKRE
mmetsp:Transcript_13510/g.15472  ORF Transcript_13510/g.15472 Transcript_13510/m.15472 type:complete len:176 (-) Transcript_13510:218-745(-)|eukprot:CAMPEP_0176425792 /NCGR_PEP_ID=MMETSP0127-20121128/11583_1 /TAXON_ID=938130 /ORGANISM="Platyophrya macrostoma, Strain WH" /LENGTH=175 /DNA_ID=CAMNT_0017806987 /DNA_START=39 /DNA_END=566 /DNA_ORIENTATION=+